MPYQVPPAVNYPSPLVALSTIYNRVPPDGSRMIPVEIDWGSMGGTSHCVAINLQNNATLNFSQIVALSVDNSDCGADVRFVFPDTGETTTIPAYAPKTIFEVFTNQTQFYVQAGLNNQVVESTDQTRFSIHNSLPPPVAVPITVEQETVAANNLAADGATAYNLIPAGINGTIESIQVLRTSPITTTGTQRFGLNDGAGHSIAVGQFDATTGQSHNDVLLSINPCHIRFSNGLTLTQSGANVGGSYCVNILYRQP